MLQTENALIFVGAVRNKGVSQKGNEYDFANIEVSDGIGSLEWPIIPELVPSLVETYKRGDKVKLRVDVRKSGFGKTEFIVHQVLKA